MTAAPSPTISSGWVHDLGPGIVAASTFAVSNVLSKIAMGSGTDVLTLSLFRGLVGVAMLFLWLRYAVCAPPHTPRARWISLGIGVLFAGVVFGLFASFREATVPIGILTYFVYPLVTGILGALLGIERLSWQGAAAALVAFLGLALLIGAHPHELALAGLAFALGAAACRTAILLITRSTLSHSDPQVTTWYTLLSSTAVFALIALVTWNWQGPQTVAGWAAMCFVGVGTTIGVLTLFVSIKRIGPFRSALIMNLEPLFSTILSAPVLGEVITPVQALGGAIMLAAVVAFQLRR
jgi:drug/metabolite transporter (DMT)-like permease